MVLYSQSFFPRSGFSNHHPDFLHWVIVTFPVIPIDTLWTNCVSILSIEVGIVARVVWTARLSPVIETIVKHLYDIHPKTCLNDLHEIICITNEHIHISIFLNNMTFSHHSLRFPISFVQDDVKLSYSCSKCRAAMQKGTHKGTSCKRAIPYSTKHYPWINMHACKIWFSHVLKLYRGNKIL